MGSYLRLGEAGSDGIEQDAQRISEVGCAPHVAYYPRILKLTACRFFVHPMIVQLGEKIVSKFRQTSQQAMLFPTHEIATRCLAYLQENCEQRRCLCHASINSAEYHLRP